MTRVDLLRAELKDAHESLEGTMADVTQELLDRMPAGIANPIGERYAHHATAEDSLVNLIIRREAPLMSSTWQGRTGISEPRFGSDPQYARSVRVRLVTVRDYARAVYAQTDAYLASIRDEDLDRAIDLSPLPFGSVPVWWILARLVIAHAFEVNGEVAAVKGVLGVRGFPY